MGDANAIIARTYAVRRTGYHLRMNLLQCVNRRSGESGRGHSRRFRDARDMSGLLPIADM